MITLTGILLIIVGLFILKMKGDISVFGIILVMVGIGCVGYGVLPVLEQLK